MTEPAMAADGEAVRDYENAADELIANCGGPARDAVIATMAHVEILEHELTTNEIGPRRPDARTEL